MEDINKGRNKGYELRDKFENEAPGVGPKTASIFMIKCGYDNIIPIDVWEMRFLSDKLDQEIKLPDYVNIGGPNHTEHSEFEKEVSKIIDKFKQDNSELSNKYNITPALFHCTLWGKYSGWREKIPYMCNLFEIMNEN